MIVWVRRHGRPILEPSKDILLAILSAVGWFAIWLFRSTIDGIGGALRLLTKKEFWLVVLGVCISQTMMLGAALYRKTVDDFDAFINGRQTVSVEVPPLSKPEKNPYTEDELYCLARVVFGEAKGESGRGKELVAMVVINRALSSAYAQDLCKVVQQDQQFHGYSASMNLAVKTDFDAFIHSYNVARETLRRYVYSPSSEKDILFFHADYVRPAWAKSMERAFVEGQHIFYRVGGPAD